MNTKMKVLSLALVGMFGYVGAASAACPAGPAIADGGAWSSKAVSQGNMAITANPGMGLDTTACRLQVSLNQASPLFAKAIVTDTSPANEVRYRARFYLDTTELTGLTSVLRGAKIFNASATSGPANASGEMVTISMNGSTGAPTLIFTIGDTTQGSGFRQVSVPLPVAQGSNRVEFDLTQGANASFRYWVSAANAVTTDASPTGTIPGINNTGWSGVKQASLGLFVANNGWRANFASTNHLYVDEFDSRRQTFIGQ